MSRDDLLDQVVDLIRSVDLCDLTERELTVLMSALQFIAPTRTPVLRLV
ncbi:hypothetical protein [Gordonia zhaorongruii]|nr:hypothetical protein [Gordonia zhaorongruii]